MRVAVVQHARQDTPAQDVALLLESTVDACSRGAEVVVLPGPAWLSAADMDAIARADFIADRYPDVTLVLDSAAAASAPAPSTAEGKAPATVGAAAPQGARVLETPMGRTALLVGDECIDSLVAAELLAAEPDAVILWPGSESDLQAEAMLERALALSEAVTGLVLIAETDGNPPGEPGHGGSAIIVLGELAAEAEAGNDVLLADVSAPVAQPDGRSPLPVLPPILAQRWARHRGERVTVDYPADAS